MNLQRKVRQGARRVVLFAVAAGPFVGCISPHAHAGRDADASISGIRAEVQEMSAALAKFETRLNAGGDISTNDAWTLRLLGLGVMLLGLSYPVGKIVWLTLTGIRQKAGANANDKSAESATSGIPDFLALKERWADILTPAGRQTGDPTARQSR